MKIRFAAALVAGAVLVSLSHGAVMGAEAGVNASAGLLRPGPPPLERFIAPLSLTASQQAQLRPMFEHARQQAEQDVKDASSDGKKPDAAQLTATMRMREADLRTLLAGVLTPAQLTQFEQMTADRTPREQAAETHGAHGHHETDTPASAAESGTDGRR